LTRTREINSPFDLRAVEKNNGRVRSRGAFSTPSGQRDGRQNMSAIGQPCSGCERQIRKKKRGGKPWRSRSISKQREKNLGSLMVNTAGEGSPSTPRLRSGWRKRARHRGILGDGEEALEKGTVLSGPVRGAESLPHPGEKGQRRLLGRCLHGRYRRGRKQGRAGNMKKIDPVTLSSARLQGR